MTIIEFPKVKVEIPELPNYGYHNPRFFDLIFGEERSLLGGALALTLAAGVQNAKKLIGATLDEYILAAIEFRSREIESIEHLEWQALNVLVEKLASNGWVYGVIPRESPFRGKYIFQTPGEMREYVQGTSKNYDRYCLKTNKKALEVLFFVPSRAFTQQIWGFDYTLDCLGKREQFKSTQS